VNIQPSIEIFQSQVVSDLGHEAHVGRAGHRFLDADRFRQRQPEHREAIGHADAQVNRQRGRRHQPAVEARSRRWCVPYFQLIE
jgi:hypothetical protein